jgi:hypothetical protein
MAYSSYDPTAALSGAATGAYLPGDYAESALTGALGGAYDDLSGD